MTSNPCCIVVAPASPNLGVCRVWFFCPSTVPPLQRFIYFVVWQLVRLTEDWDCRYTKLMSWLLVAEGSWEQVQYWFDWGGLVRDGARGLADQENSVLVRFKVLNMCLPTSRCCHVLPKPLLKDTMIHEFIPDFCFAFCVSLSINCAPCNYSLHPQLTIPWRYWPCTRLATHAAPSATFAASLARRRRCSCTCVFCLFCFFCLLCSYGSVKTSCNLWSLVRWTSLLAAWNGSKHGQFDIPFGPKSWLPVAGFSLHRWHSFCGRPDAESHISDLR
jgi:hypothetical protein